MLSQTSAHEELPCGSLSQDGRGKGAAMRKLQRTSTSRGVRPGVDSAKSKQLPCDADTAADATKSHSAVNSKRWQKDRDPNLERLYVDYERIADAFIGRLDHKMVQAMEAERIDGEGDVEKMRVIVEKYRSALADPTRTAKPSDRGLLK